MHNLAGSMILGSLRRRARRSAITFAGVAFAVAAMVVLGAIMIGVGDAMIRNSVAIHTGHVHAAWPPDQQVDRQALQRIEQLPYLHMALWRKRHEGVLDRGSKQVTALLEGVQRNREQSESVVPQKLTAGSYLPEENTLVLGSALAARLCAHVGDEVIFRPLAGSPLQLRVSGVFETGIEALDVRLIYARYENVPGPADELTLFLNSPADAEMAADQLRCLLPVNAQVQTWRQALPELVQLISLNHVSMNIVLALTLLVLAFAVSNTVFLSVSERTHEFGILKAMGIRPGELAALVLAETLALVSVAAALGVGLGWIGAALWGQWGLNLAAWTSANPHFIASGVIYPRVDLARLLLPAVTALACGLLASLPPALRAGRISVVEALRSL